MLIVPAKEIWIDALLGVQMNGYHGVILSMRGGFWSLLQTPGTTISLMI